VTTNDFSLLFSNSIPSWSTKQSKKWHKDWNNSGALSFILKMGWGTQKGGYAKRDSVQSLSFQCSLAAVSKLLPSYVKKDINLNDHKPLFFVFLYIRCVFCVYGSHPATLTEQIVVCIAPNQKKFDATTRAKDPSACGAMNRTSSRNKVVKELRRTDKRNSPDKPFKSIPSPMSA
jgi:hypothetical protein